MFYATRLYADQLQTQSRNIATGAPVDLTMRMDQPQSMNSPFDYDPTGVSQNLRGMLVTLQIDWTTTFYCRDHNIPNKIRDILTGSSKYLNGPRADVEH